VVFYRSLFQKLGKIILKEWFLKNRACTLIFWSDKVDIITSNTKFLYK